jgi:S1-C subfamily serine protease
VKGGVLVKSVARGSAAERAGLRAGDVIVAVDGREPVTASDLRKNLAIQRKLFSLTVIRDRQSLTIMFDNRQ